MPEPARHGLKRVPGPAAIVNPCRLDTHGLHESDNSLAAGPACAAHPVSGGSDRWISYTVAGCLFASQAFASVYRVIAKPAHLIRVRPDRCVELFPIMPGHIGRAEYIEAGIAVGWSRNWLDLKEWVPPMEFDRCISPGQPYIRK